MEARWGTCWEEPFQEVLKAEIGVRSDLWTCEQEGRHRMRLQACHMRQEPSLCRNQGLVPSGWFISTTCSSWKSGCLHSHGASTLRVSKEPPAGPLTMSPHRPHKLLLLPRRASEHCQRLEQSPIVRECSVICSCVQEYSEGLPSAVCSADRRGWRRAPG